MIDEIDARLADWIEGVLGKVTVSFGPPGDESGTAGIGLYLTDLVSQPVARNGRREALQVELRYLVTAWAKDPKTAHRNMGDLVFAALDNPEFEVDRDPLPLELWVALGVPPRPAFVLQVPVRKEKPLRPVRPVLEPLVLHQSPVTTLEGVVLGPNDLPIAGAQVGLPALGRRTRCDTRGRFRFDAVPADPPIRHIDVNAKGQHRRVTLDKRPPVGEPVVVHLELEV